MPRLSDRHPGVRTRTQNGFTLIELMIVITLLGIFAAIAVPSFTQFVNKSRSQSFNNELLELLQYARASAVERRTFVRACKEDTAWTVKKACTDTDVIRRLDIPSTITATTTATPISFRYNGSGTEATLVTCQGADSANGFTINVKASGSIQAWPRGKNGTSSNMSSCQ